jgi:hypothetical protein
MHRLVLVASCQAKLTDSSACWRGRVAARSGGPAFGLWATWARWARTLATLSPPHAICRRCGHLVSRRKPHCGSADAPR